MKNISFKYLMFAFFLIAGITACNDFEDENYDFSNSLSQYVELVSGDPVGPVISGSEIPVDVQLRIAVQSPVTVNYEITGDFTGTGTITIESGQVSGSSTITIPDTPDTGTATVKLTGVDNGLSVGRGAAEDGLSATEFEVSWAP